MSKALSSVSLKVLADAEQFINEFRRAERAAQGSTGRIGNEVDKMAKTLSKKFSLGDIGKSMLQGFGLGSGFAVVDTVFSKITQIYQEHQAELAKIDDTWKRIIEKSKAYAYAKLTPLDKRAQLQAEMDDLIRRRDASVMSKPIKGQIAGAFGVTYEATPTWGSTKDRKEMADFTTQIAEHAMEIENLNAAIGSLADTASASDFGLFNASLAIEAEAMSENLKALTGSMTDLTTQAKLHDSFLFDPVAIGAAADEHERLAQIAREHAAVWAEVWGFMGTDFGLSTITEGADDAAEKITEVSNSAREMGWAFESAFEDAILEGEKLSDVLDGLVKDIMRVAIRSSITQPLGEWVGGIFSGQKTPLGGIFGAIGDLFKAEGGPVSGGRPYIVGEQGPEMIVPRSSGTVIPNHALGGSGGGTYYIDARGADRTGLARLEAMIRALHGSIEPRALAAVADHRRRGAFA